MQNVILKQDMHRQKAASLTVEASLVLPFFVFAVLFFLYFFQFLYLQDSVQTAITEAGKFLSRYEKVSEELKLSEGVKELLLKQRFYEYLDKETINKTCITGGIYGIFVSMEEENPDSEIKITARYQIGFPIPFFGEKKSLVIQKVKTRAFVGLPIKKTLGRVDRDEHESDELQEQVYVTENGTVYHLSESCTHLKLSISAITSGQIKYARNENGGRYKACEKCVGNRQAEGTVYIAREGDRYHNSLGCSGLKRMVYTVLYTEVLGKRRCSRCG